MLLVYQICKQQALPDQRNTPRVDATHAAAADVARVIVERATSNVVLLEYQMDMIYRVKNGDEAGHTDRPKAATAIRWYTRTSSVPRLWRQDVFHPLPHELASD